MSVTVFVQMALRGKSEVIQMKKVLVHALFIFNQNSILIFNVYLSVKYTVIFKTDKFLKIFEILNERTGIEKQHMRLKHNG